jgi:formylglycine-generating enzyme required for sulfatase activity
VIRGLLLCSVATVALAQSPEFVPIPAGSFVMGCEVAEPCAKSLPKKLVTIERAFQLSKYEVTVGQFRAFVKAAGYITDAERSGDVRTWRSPGFARSSRQPVVFMSLNDATAYCEFIGARVPMEAEWEYAARAGSTTHHYWGEEIDGRYLWYFGNTEERPMPVGRKLPNKWGLFDMEGNAMEWVRDGGPHSSITRAGAGSLRGGSYAMCPEPYPPSQGIRQRFIGLGPTFQGFENSTFRRDERRFDFGIRCAR